MTSASSANHAETRDDTTEQSRQQQGAATAKDKPAARDRLSLAARLLTEVFAPAVLAAVMPITMALAAESNVVAGLGWGVLGAAFTAVVPYAIIRLGMWRGELKDHHIGDRSKRAKPFALSLISVAVGAAVIAIAGGPRELVGTIAVMFTVLLAGTVVNLWWKASVHGAVIAGSCTMLMLAFGFMAWPAWILAGAVGWSRVRLRDHTTAQVIAGLAMGVPVAAAVYSLITGLWRP